MKVIYRYEPAEKVLKQLVELIELYAVDKADQVVDPVIVSMYQNGREQGYEVTYWLTPVRFRKVTFSEFRKSDDIVVYQNNKNMQSLSDEAYATAKFFKPNDIMPAAKYCFEFLFDTKFYLV